jgi:uncharacterized protein (TIGR04255 family)
MGDKLLSPPLIEALCEFRFAQSTPWDWTFPGRLYDQLSKDFPERSQVDGVGVQIQFGPGKPVPSEVFKGPDRIQMKRTDGSAMVQVGPHLLAVNHLRPYSDWDSFRTLILSVFEKYIQLSGGCSLARIGLRFINQIQLTRDSWKLKDIITVMPPLKGTLDRLLSGFYQRYEILYDSPRGILIHQTGIQETEQAKALMLDLDFGSMDLQGVCDQSGVGNLLDAAHGIVYECFVASLTPEFYGELRRGKQ